MSMFLQRYEMLMLARSEVTDDELGVIEKNFDQILKKFDGSVTRFDKWGKYQLAYPIKKSSYGIYAVTEYEIPGDKLREVQNTLKSFLRIKCAETVLRHVIVRVDDDQGSSFSKPEPLDTTEVSKDLSVLKESKIENLLDSVELSEQRAEAEQDNSSLQKNANDRNIADNDAQNDVSEVDDAIDSK